MAALLGSTVPIQKMTNHVNIVIVKVYLLSKVAKTYTLEFEIYVQI